MEKEPTFFDSCDEAKLESLIKRHSDVLKKQKDAAQGKNVRIFCCLHVFDDMADDASVMKISSNSILKPIIPLWSTSWDIDLVFCTEALSRQRTYSR